MVSKNLLVEEIWIEGSIFGDLKFMRDSHNVLIHQSWQFKTTHRVSCFVSRNQIWFVEIFILNVRLNINGCILLQYGVPSFFFDSVDSFSLVYLNRYGCLLPAGLSVPAEQVNPHGSTVRKTEARVEEAFRNKQKPTMAVWPNSTNKCACKYLGW